MTKPFLTYQQQIQKLIVEKHLIINNSALAEEKLRNIGHFSLIGGYKQPFRNSMTRVYVDNTTFEDVWALYQFDNELRELLFNHLCQIEKKMRSLLSYAWRRWRRIFWRISEMSRTIIAPIGSMIHSSKWFPEKV